MQHLPTTGAWTYDWFWGIALIVGSAMLHAFGIMLIAQGMQNALDFAERFRSLRPLERFSAAVTAASLSLVILHGLEAALWAVVLVWLDACPDFKSAIYFSLQMATTLGADIVQLTDRWKLMGPLEGMSGMLMFGISTAFLFAVMRRVWPYPDREPG
jgi:ion channel